MIVDASAVIVSFSDPAVTLTIEDHVLLAPELLIAETLNAFWKLRRNGKAVPARAAILALLDEIQIVPSRSIAVRAAALAEELDHPIYDCFYLALAEAEDDVLLTADARLSRKLPAPLRRRVRLIAATR